ncbi:YciI family protein [Fulvivirgaceae bacterium BMA12]|uniref:YciI family protein n=1 Tax=Agaribacillus aureus TaxID=3051825 RepID=A0ABT8L589_9BACT|nr:YciI family protein [Fulvivirgaceae bacterium BMA12]
MKNFMLLLREEIEETQKLPPQEFQELVAAHMNWVQELTEKGIFKGGEGLEYEGKTIKNATRVVSDGPFIETKECVGGYYIIQAADIDAAVEIAKNCPCIKYPGSIEVRAVSVY